MVSRFAVQNLHTSKDPHTFYNWIVSGTDISVVNLFGLNSLLIFKLAKLH